MKEKGVNLSLHTIKYAGVSREIKKILKRGCLIVALYNFNKPGGF
jgi:hypothetical protein